MEEELWDKDLLSDPSRIYNAQMKSWNLCMKSNQVVGIKGAPVVYNLGNSDKTQLTVMAAFSASAHFIPPQWLFSLVSDFPITAWRVLRRLPKADQIIAGWTLSSFFKWLENVLIPAVNERCVKEPVLLLIDGHMWPWKLSISACNRSTCNCSVLLRRTGDKLLGTGK